MTCEEFRAALNGWLDGRKSAPLSAGARRHAEGCPACARYAAVMEHLDAGLRDIPRVGMPEAVTAIPDRLETGRGVHSGSVRLAAVTRPWVPVVLPPLLVWCAGWLHPPVWAEVLRFLLATAGLMLFGVASLRPRFTGV